MGGDGTTTVPAELQALLNSNPGPGSLTVGTVIPELRTQLLDVTSGPRRHDLVLLALDSHGRRTLVGVEAKADEPFDAPVEDRVREAQQAAAVAADGAQAYESAQIPRIERFSRTLIGREAFLPDGTLDPLVRELPYQLLSGLAGTLIEAAKREAAQAMFVVHAFHSAALDSVKLASNDAGFTRFVAALTGESEVELRYGELRGPLAVPGGDGIPSLPLYIGIAATQVNTARP